MSALLLQLNQTKPLSTTTPQLRSALAKRKSSVSGQPTIMNITVFWGSDAASFCRHVQVNCCFHLHDWTGHVAKNGYPYRKGTRNGSSPITYVSLYGQLPYLEIVAENSYETGNSTYLSNYKASYPRKQSPLLLYPQTDFGETGRGVVVDKPLYVKHLVKKTAVDNVLKSHHTHCWQLNTSISTKYYIWSPTRYTTFVMLEYLFTTCLTAQYVSDLQVHPQEHL